MDIISYSRYNLASPGYQTGTTAGFKFGGNNAMTVPEPGTAVLLGSVFLLGLFKSQRIN